MLKRRALIVPLEDIQMSPLLGLSRDGGRPRRFCCRRGPDEFCAIWLRHHLLVPPRPEPPHRQHEGQPAGNVADDRPVFPNVIALRKLC